MKKEEDNHWCLGNHSPDEECNDLGEFLSPEDRKGPFIVRDLPKTGK